MFALVHVSTTKTEHRHSIFILEFKIKERKPSLRTKVFSLVAQIYSLLLRVRV